MPRARRGETVTIGKDFYDHMCQEKDRWMLLALLFAEMIEQQGGDPSAILRMKKDEIGEAIYNIQRAKGEHGIREME